MQRQTILSENQASYSYFPVHSTWLLCPTIDESKNYLAL